jgi:hypothetical protein
LHDEFLFLEIEDGPLKKWPNEGGTAAGIL